MATVHTLPTHCNLLVKSSAENQHRHDCFAAINSFEVTSKKPKNYENKMNLFFSIPIIIQYERRKEKHAKYVKAEWSHKK